MQGKRRAFYSGEQEPIVTLDQLITAGNVPVSRRGSVITFRSVHQAQGLAHYQQVDFGPDAATVKLVDEAAFLSSKPGRIVLGEFTVDEKRAAREAKVAAKALAQAKRLYPQAWA